MVMTAMKQQVRPFTVSVPLDLPDVIVIANDGVTHYSIVISSYKAFHHPPSEWLVEQFSDISDERKESIMLCVHEAISNAVLHGNLKIDSFESDAESFRKYQTLLAERLVDKRYAERSIFIRCKHSKSMIVVEVEDEGDGYNFEHAIQKNQSSPYARGLRMMQLYATRIKVSSGGTCIRMEFNLDAV